VTRGLLLRLLALAGSSMIRRLRLISGLVMLAYVTMHLLNHAVGLISLDAMENVLWYIFRIWTNRPAQLLLYGSQGAPFGGRGAPRARRQRIIEELARS
jgi:hypothetical protein